jgi:hypothetical protein
MAAFGRDGEQRLGQFQNIMDGPVEFVAHRSCSIRP